MEAIKMKYYKYGSRYLAIGKDRTIKVCLYDFHISIESEVNGQVGIIDGDISISKLAFTRALNKAKRYLIINKII